MHVSIDSTNEEPLGPTLVDQLTSELSRAADTHGLQAAAGLFTWARAANALRRGNWVEANDDAQQWMDGSADSSGLISRQESSRLVPSQNGLSVTRVFSQAMAAYTAAAIGDVPRATTLAETVLATDAATQFPEISAWCWSALGSLAYAQGDTARALDYLGRVAEVAAVVADGGRITEPTRLYWEGDWIDALIDAARIEEATAAVAKLRAYAERTGDLWTVGVVARCVGRLEPSALQSEEQFHQAMTAFEQDRLEFEIARTFCTRGAHFRGERASASFDIAEGFRRLQRIGAVQWANWSVGLLRSESETLRKDDRQFSEAPTRNWADASPGVVAKGSTGLAVPPETLRSNTELPLQLTPSELRVASLITTGSTYKEIAGALFISTKTVDFHVQAMYRKAKVKNRVEFVGSFLRMAHA
jgi:DNA-binding CsgD family transcriptional regulator